MKVVDLTPYSIPFVILLFFLIASCTSEKPADAQNNEKTIEQTDTVKQQIQSFWDNYRKAQKYRVEGKWQEAIQYYTKSLAINNKHEDSWFNLGNMYLELNEYKQAEECWTTIVELNPNSARAHMQLGRLYLSWERPEIFNLQKAKTEFTTTSAINKVVTGPLMLLGHVALLEGDIALAKRYLQSVIGSDTKNVEAYFLLSYIAWKMGNTSKTEEYFSEAIKFSKPEEAVKGVLSEGDTKDGSSYLRPINESIFFEYFKDLYKPKHHQKITLPESKYQLMDEKIKALDVLSLYN